MSSIYSILSKKSSRWKPVCAYGMKLIIFGTNPKSFSSLKHQRNAWRLCCLRFCVGLLSYAFGPLDDVLFRWTSNVSSHLGCADIRRYGQFDAFLLADDLIARYKFIWFNEFVAAVKSVSSYSVRWCSKCAGRYSFSSLFLWLTKRSITYSCIT